MSERKLEPTPGWCERAQKMLVLYTNRAHFASQLIAEYEAAQKSGLLKHAGTWKGDDFEDCLAAVKPKPAPLPHEPYPNTGSSWMYAICRDCGAAMTRAEFTKPCPARNEPPAEKAEALPELLRPLVSGAVRTSLPPTLEALVDYLKVPHDRDYARDVFGSLLAECRRIARDELSKARIENRYLGGEWTRATLLRIVPGKEGE